MNEGASWWQVVAIPALIASIPGVFRAYQWWTERKDRAGEKYLSSDEKKQAALLAEREQLTKEQRETFERVEAERDRVAAEVERERIRVREIERDRDRGWDLARYWNRRAHDMRQVAANAQRVADNIAQDAGRDGPLWPDLTMPLFEEPK